MSSGHGRGFVFSADALIAVIIAGIALTALAQVNQSKGDVGGLRAIAEAELAVADADGTLTSTLSMTATQANTTVTAFLADTLSSINGARFSLTVYSWANSSQTFSTQYSVANSIRPPASGGVSGRARRFFTSPDLNRYGVVDLDVWRS